MILRSGICVLLLTAAFAQAADPAPSATAAPGEKITFNKHIAPLLYTNCANCHRTGEVAPFELLSYDDAKKRSKLLAKVTRERVMPPWKATPDFGDFRDARHMNDAQIVLFQQWHEQGALEGDAKDLPARPKFPEGWQLGKPDLVMEMPESYTAPAEGRDVFRCFVIPFNNTEDLYVSAVEYRPGNRRVVHHALLFLDTSGAARKKDQADPGPGYTAFGGPGFLPSGGLGGWAPGSLPHPLPEGLAKVVKKNSDLAVQIHFHPTGKPETERSQIGIYFAKKAPEREVAGLVMGSRKIDIAPGDKEYRVTDEFVLPCDIELLTLTPHAHLICKEIKATATLPDGKVEPLIWIKEWDFDWQDQYMYRNPLKLPKGSRLNCSFSYDNSSDNPNNPSSPPKRMKFGEQTTEEMAFLFMQAVVPTKLEQAQLLAAMVLRRFSGGGVGVGLGAASAFGGGDDVPKGANLRLLRERADTNKDGKVSDEELQAALKAFLGEQDKKK